MPIRLCDAGLSHSMLVEDQLKLHDGHFARPPRKLDHGEYIERDSAEPMRLLAGEAWLE